MPYQSIFFDLDGTLTDPKPGITRSIQYALRELGLDSPSEDELAIYIGPPLRQSFATLLDTDEPDRIEQAITYFRNRFTRIGLYENTVYAGIEALLATTQTIAPLYLATAKPKPFATHILEHFNLKHFFTDIYGSELSGKFENKVELLEHLLQTEKLQPEHCLMIGDRAMDITA
ncbi:MAG: HAD hydrolase-like protein, partial [Synechococcales bacterium]|nr:HAD hydrolase-like protein [Synechococcales bacterium]